MQKWHLKKYKRFSSYLIPHIRPGRLRARGTLVAAAPPARPVAAKRALADRLVRAEPPHALELALAAQSAGELHQPFARCRNPRLSVLASTRVARAARRAECLVAARAGLLAVSNLLLERFHRWLLDWLVFVHRCCCGILRINSCPGILLCRRRLVRPCLMRVTEQNLQENGICF